MRDKENFNKQKIKIDSEGLFGIGNLDHPDIPIPEGVFTYAQRSGKYAQFIVVAVANYSIGLTSTGTVEENSYYKAWANTEGNNGETLKLIDENLRINLLTNTDDQYFPKTNGDVLPMVARGTFSLLKGENVLLEGNEYNRIGVLQLKRIASKVGLRVVSATNQSFTLTGISFLNAVNSMLLFNSEVDAYQSNRLVNTGWLAPNANMVQQINGNDYYVFYINEIGRASLRERV